MHKRSIVVFMGGLLGLAVAGCVGGTGEDTATYDHAFIQNPSGEITAVDPSTVPPAEEMTKTFGDTSTIDKALSTPGLESQYEQGGGCSGACNSNICVCQGDFNCCAVGCGICFALADQP